MCTGRGICRGVSQAGSTWSPSLGDSESWGTQSEGVPGLRQWTSETREEHGMGKNEFSARVDEAGLRLTDEQKSILFEAYPLFQKMVARATPPLPREAEPSVMFNPEVK